MIAAEDDIITCERGHPLYRITRDVQHNERVRAEQFEAIHPRAVEPAVNRSFGGCPMCRAPWYAKARSSGPGWSVWRTHFHFEDGWRPRLPD